jgi:hypothetical protein
LPLPISLSVPPFLTEALKSENYFALSLDLPTGFEILSTKKVARLLEQDKISESFLLSIKPDTTLHEMSLSQDEIFSKAVPGNSIPGLEMRLLLAQNRDLFRTELPEINMFKNTRSVIPLVPRATIPNIPI